MTQLETYQKERSKLMELILYIQFLQHQKAIDNEQFGNINITLNKRFVFLEENIRAMKADENY